MLHIIGIILKCIGILLAVILALIVLVLVTVLFAPIRFEVDAVFPGKPEEITASAKVTWIMTLIRADVAWKEQKLDWRVRAAWKVFDGKEETAEAEAKPEQKKDTKPVKTKPVEKRTEKTSEEKKAEEKTTEEKKSEEIKSDDAAPRVEKKSFVKTIKEMVQSILNSIKCTFQKICDKIKEGICLKDKIVEFLTNKTHQLALLRIKKELIWLKRFFKIKDGEIRLKLGFEDPAATGQALAGLSVLYALLEGRVYVEPDFEEKCLEGNVDLKGRLRLIHLAILAIKILLDENVRQTYKDIKAFKNS